MDPDTVEDLEAHVEARFVQCGATSPLSLNTFHTEGKQHVCLVAASRYHASSSTGLGEASARNFSVRFQCSELAISIENGQHAGRDVHEVDATASVDRCSHLAAKSTPHKIGQQN